MSNIGTGHLGSQGWLHTPYKAVQSIERFSNSGSREWISLEKESRSGIQANTKTHFNIYLSSWCKRGGFGLIGLTDLEYSTKMVMDMWVRKNSSGWRRTRGSARGRLTLCSRWDYLPASIWSLTSTVYQRCDLNKDGRLDYSEFKMLIFRNRERKEPSRGEDKSKIISRRKSCKIPEYEKWYNNINSTFILYYKHQYIFEHAYDNSFQTSHWIEINAD